MREYQRNSTEISLSSLPADCRSALEEHIETHKLKLNLETATLCLKVESQKIKKGLFSGGTPKEVESYILLLPGWLLWTVSTEGGPPTAISARLEDLRFENYADSPSYKLIEDDGLMVTGKLTGMVGTQGQEAVSMFIGLGVGPAAEKFTRSVDG